MDSQKQVVAVDPGPSMRKPEYRETGVRHYVFCAVDGVGGCLGLWVALLPLPTFYLEPICFPQSSFPLLGVTPKLSAER